MRTYPDIETLYIHSFYGDVRLERVSAKETRVVVAKATPLEQTALNALVKHAVKKTWLDESAAGAFLATADGSFILRAGVLAIQKNLAKALKPGRDVITVVQFADGKMQEIVEASTDDAARAEAPSTSVAPASAPAPETALVPAKAAAVSKPYLGCPAPAFAQAELRANRVLEAFLTPEQKEDFRAHDCFMTIGAATGHRYMVTSRHAPAQLHRYGGRTLFDMDDDTALCVHDWEVPPAEEMLALHLLASLPHHELYLRRLEHEA